MIYAIGNDSKRKKATPAGVGTCPHCSSVMVPKCGDINIWHWAHKSTKGCDAWRESETDWHRQWKSIVPSERAEVTISNFGQRHRADIITSKGVVVELQHSAISTADIAEREAFYGDMIWVFDISDCLQKRWIGNYGGVDYFDNRFQLHNKGNYYTFRWKHPRKHIAYTTKPTFLDFGDINIFRLRRMYPDAPCGGWGNLLRRYKFIERLKAA